jgi:transketolase
MDYSTFNSNKLALKVSKRIIELAFKKKASHIGGSLSITDILAVLYSNLLKYNIDTPNHPSRDRLFYSKGHACLALYSVLCEMGFYSVKELESFTSNGSSFTSHVNSNVPGIELSTGSLGHALSVACGVAMAGKRKKESWNVYTILSDGELDEGSNWEGFLFAAHHELNNLTIIIDYNKIQSFGTVKEVMNLDPLVDKFKAFNFYTLEIDGHDHDSILKALQDDGNGTMPKVIIANTIKGKGVDYMEHQLAWHYKSPDVEQLKNALSQLNS